MNEREVLALLAEVLGPNGHPKEGLGPRLLDDPGIRQVLGASWWRAWNGSKEDVRAMAKIGEALVALKKRKPRSDDPHGAHIIEGWFRRLDELVPRDEKKAARFKGREFVGSEMLRARKKKRADDERVLGWLYDKPEALDVLLTYRGRGVHRQGHLPFYRMARAFVRPMELPKDVEAAIRNERRRRARGRKKP